MSTILKWAGNKTRLMPELINHLPQGQRLVEPFAGSCAVMMATDYPAYLVADVNPDLINLYRQIKDHTRPFIVVALSLYSQNKTAEDYYRVREAFNHDPALTLLERAAHFLYLSRHGYRGICRYNRKSEFNIPYGNYSAPYFPLEEIETFAAKAHRATFVCADFRETLSMLQTGDVVYCDPPYDGTFNAYHAGGFDKAAQQDLASMLTSVSERCPVIASNSDTDFTRTLFNAYELTSVRAARSVGVAAGDGKSAAEIIAVRRPAVWIGFDPAASSEVVA